jgi:hypothetical protein
MRILITENQLDYIKKLNHTKKVFLDSFKENITNTFRITILRQFMKYPLTQLMYMKICFHEF